MNQPKHSFSPQWAQHVTGTWNSPTFDEDGKLEPIPFQAFCSICNAEVKGECTTGSVKTRIAKFAYVHNHKDDKKP